MPTNMVIITDALTEINAIADGQTASASELADGLTTLNRMMAQDAVNDMDIGFFPQDMGSDTCPIPIWAEQGVTAKLAINLASIFHLPVTAETIKRATDGDELIAKMVIKSNLDGANMDHMHVGSGSWRSDILSGDSN